MSTIQHLFHIEAPPAIVYKALATVKGLSEWWTRDTFGAAEVGSILEFKFGEVFLNKMRVVEMEPEQSVTWECVSGPADWVGTRITFELEKVDAKTRLRFSHSNWREQNDFFAQCNFSWGRYLESLRQYCQTGYGFPFEDPEARRVKVKIQ